MRTVGELSGLAVIGEATGERLGRVQDVLFSPTNGGQIAAFLVHPGGMLSRARVLPRLFVRRLGADALLVESGHVLDEAKEEHEVEGAIRAQSLNGRPVLDDAGKVVGHVADVVIDEATLTAAALQVSTGLVDNMLHGKPTVPLSLIKAIGPDSIVIPAAYNLHGTEHQNA